MMSFTSMSQSTAAHSNPLTQLKAHQIMLHKHFNVLVHIEGLLCVPSVLCLSWGAPAERALSMKPQPSRCAQSCCKSPLHIMQKTASHV